jgi:hypothetical protein
MAKGQHLSKYQKGIVNRYYEHKDTINATKLAETVSELYLCDDPKKAAKHWKAAELALTNLGVQPAKIAPIIANKDIKALAELAHKAAQ